MIFIKSITNKKYIFCYLILFFVLSNFFGQEVPSIIEHIRLPLWAEIDSFPSEELYDKTSGPYDYAVKGVKKIAPYIFEGMVYGWDFTYTPSDKGRAVEEYFEIVPKEDYKIPQVLIKYSSPWLEDNKLNCWCEYTRTSSEVQNFYLWKSIKNPRIKGTGYGSLSKGFDGIQDAFSDAVKNAVREYYRTIVKNKPKEITGAVLIRDLPVIGVDAGKYVVNLDFFLENGTIILYTQY